MVPRQEIKLNRPLYVMLKPVGARCNLACDYCYYLSKQKIYESSPRHLMSESLLELFIQEYISAQTTDEVLFTWHGGEPLLRPLSFYRRAIELQRKYADGKTISNALQTNGTLITEEWARFLHDEGWLVGVSIDGPQEFHDTCRRTPDNRPSWAKVRKGIDLLNRFQVEWNAMAVVNAVNADHPLDFYRFFRDDLQCRYLQFAPIVETEPSISRQGTEQRVQSRTRSNYAESRRNSNKGQGARNKGLIPPLQGRLGEVTLAPLTITPIQWGNFLCAIFDEWISHGDAGEMFVQLFDATLANWCGITPGVCTMARSCGHAAVMEWNGDVYACDHFVFPQYKLGNLKEQHLVEMMYGPRQTDFSHIKQDQLSDDCRQCEWLFACNGECPKNRILPGRRNYLCEGYRHFFSHVAPWMDNAKRQLQGRV